VEADVQTLKGRSNAKQAQKEEIGLKGLQHTIQ